MPLKPLSPLKPSWFFLFHAFLTFVPLKPLCFFKPSCVFKPFCSLTFKLSNGIHHLYTPFATMKILGEIQFCTNFVEFQVWPELLLVVLNFHLLFNQSPWLLHEFGLLGLNFWQLLNTFNFYMGFIKKIVWKNYMFRSSFLGEDFFVDVGFSWHSFLCVNCFPKNKIR